MHQRDDLTVTLLGFGLAGRSYGLPLEQVVEVLRMVSLTPVPDAPDWLSGILNLRGEPVPVIDLRQRLNWPAQEPGLTTPMIIGEADGRRVGLLVDTLDGIVYLPQAAITMPAAMAGAGHPVRAIGRRGEQIIVILDLPGLSMGVHRPPESALALAGNGTHNVPDRGA